VIIPEFIKRAEGTHRRNEFDRPLQRETVRVRQTRFETSEKTQTDLGHVIICSLCLDYALITDNLTS
jgi:hypothetical protein